jgi:phosphatidylethanolamine/phosphatidyl-N-methylethanolamine N-methyltransferase
LGADFNRDSIARAFGRWAPVYDLVFGQVFARGRDAAIVAAERIGGRILEVGVGTGLSLPAYARTNRLTGIDISEPMLRKAQERVRALRLDNVDALSVMDATKLAFPDAAFDVVVAQYVITAVPDPDGTMDEFARVVRPGGKIAFEVGEVRGGKVALEHAVLSAAKDLPLEPIAVMINRQAFTKTAQCWGVDNNAKGTNSNRIVVFERR